MGGDDLYHVGILVFDLDAAIEDFSQALGIDFEPIRSLPLDGRRAHDDLTGERQLRLCYSTEGAMRLELIEAQPDGVWGRQSGEGVHHVGAWSDDRPECLRRQATLGRGPEMTISHDGELSAIYFPPTTLHGVRLEMVGPFPLPGRPAHRSER